MVENPRKFRGVILFISFLFYFYYLYMLIELPKIDRLVLSLVGLIILIAISIWVLSAFIRKDMYASYNVKGSWFKSNNSGKL